MKRTTFYITAILVLLAIAGATTATTINYSINSEGADTKEMNTLFNESLKLYYSFDYNSSFGNRWYDTVNLSRISDDSTAGNWTANGKYGGAFDTGQRTLGYVYIGNNSPIIEGYGEATILTWVNPRNNKSSSNRVFQKGFANSWALMESSLKVKCYMNTSDGSVSGLTSTVAGNSNQWNLFGCVYNGTHLTTYINGQLSSSSALTGLIKPSTIEATIGASSITLNGSIDEVMAFNKSLTLEQLDYIYQGRYRQEIVYNLTLANLDTVDYYKTNRVLVAPNETGSDTTIREIGNIVYTNGQYRHVYSGHTGAYAQNQVFVHWANSSDGITWEKQGKVIVNASEDPYILYKDGIYWMYVEDKNVSSFSNITLYTSTDFITWYSNGTILSKGTSGEWDSTDVSSPTLHILSNGTFVLLYEGRGTGSNGNIGIATSTNGKDFTKYSNNPFISIGTAGQWDNDSVVPDSVYYDNGYYYISYHGTTTNAGRVWSGLLRTNDLLDKSTYTRYSKNPIDTSETTMIVNISNQINILREGATDIEISTLNKSITTQLNKINNISDWLNISITSPIYLTELQVNESWIYFNELRTSESSLNRLTFNMTQAGDYTGSDLPIINLTTTSTQNITKYISSNIYLVNVSMSIPISDCDTNLIDNYNINLGVNQPISLISCEDQAVLSAENIGDSRITLNYYNSQSNINQATNSNVLGLIIILTLVPLIILALICKAVFNAYRAGYDETSLKTLKESLIILITVGVIVIMGIIVVSIIAQSI